MSQLSDIIKNLDSLLVAEQHAAAQQLGRYDSNEVIDALSEVVLDNKREWWVRYAAAESLGNSGNPIGVPTLIAALDDETPGVKYVAVKSLGKLKDKRTIEPLIKMLAQQYHERAWVLQEAAKLLAKDRQAIAIEPEAATLKDGDIRSTVARVLGELRDELAIEPLFKLFENGNERERDSATEALRKFRTAEARAFLREIDTRMQAERRRQREELIINLIKEGRVVDDGSTRVYCPTDGSVMALIKLTSESGNMEIYRLCHYCRVGYKCSGA